MCSSIDKAVRAALLALSAVLGFAVLVAAGPARRSPSTWGKILIAGGSCREIDLPLSSAELYDPASNLFTDAARKMKSVRSGAAAGLIARGPNTGKVLITGGYGADYRELASTELYDPATSTFALGPFMHAGRVWQTATAIVSGPNAGKILIVGGQGRASTGHLALPSTELYDPVTNTFRRGSRMHAGRVWQTATTIISGPNAGKILIVGGADNNYHALSSTELYDPVSSTIYPGPTMNTPRYRHTATVITFGKNAGRILIAGGDDGRNGGIGVSSLASTELYDPATNSFLPGPTMKTARKGSAAALIDSGPNAGKILIAGGSNVECKGSHCHGDELSSTELYDPEANAFAPGPAMNYRRSGHTATVIASGPSARKILISGGTEYLDDRTLPTDLYNPASNTFALADDAPGRHGGCYDTVVVQLPSAPASATRP